MLVLGSQHDPMLVQCCAIIYDTVPTLKQLCVSVSVAGDSAKTRRLANAVLLPSHCSGQRASIKLALDECLSC